MIFSLKKGVFRFRTIDKVESENKLLAFVFNMKAIAIVELVRNQPTIFQSFPLTTKSGGDKNPKNGKSGEGIHGKS